MIGTLTFSVLIVSCSKYEHFRVKHREFVSRSRILIAAVDSCFSADFSCFFFCCCFWVIEQLPSCDSRVRNALVSRNRLILITGNSVNISLHFTFGYKILVFIIRSITCSKFILVQYTYCWRVYMYTIEITTTINWSTVHARAYTSLIFCTTTTR